MDKEADAIYIELSSKAFASNRKIDNQTIIDLDEESNIIGIELLNVSKRMPKDSIAKVSFENL